MYMCDGHPSCTETFEDAEKFVSHENNKHRVGKVHEVCTNVSSYMLCHSFAMWSIWKKKIVTPLCSLIGVEKTITIKWECKSLIFNNAP